ncbi:acyl-CoA dehydrogenase family protein [Frigoribacterium faeni]|uniref:Alkylation response protein AidB-like acyl-CoA dehydrogenase n=1 Tax=Frigoribacterium faeni TaxID=145483 RepID=A0A7W3JGG5_9MICO|nr:acyl-CoA dehydrogenase family protein [Frigoribacterium faeni]MBA8812394.1 alkylation response protein AidB-like acyl-CoA dehydrogenase [Frigoribacterium faeni]GEK81893.1 monooxygenase [Frigoribacterium faeni]
MTDLLSSPTADDTSTLDPATTAAPARSHWTGVAAEDEIAHWSAVASEVAAVLARDVLERDRRGDDPTTELDPLRSSGLVTLLDPASLGGGGAHWQTAFRVVRILARADGSLAQLLLYHYVNVANIATSAPASERERFYRRTIEGRWLWGDSVNPVDPDLRLTPDDAGGFRLNGLKRFSTGVSSGDRALVNAVVDSGDREGDVIAFVIDAHAPGVAHLGDWDALGQRQSASGSVRFTDVRVEPTDVLGALDGEPFSTLITAAIQLGFGNLYLGLAEGAIAAAREITVARPNAWFLSDAERYAEDPFVRRLYGDLVSRTAAVEALADRVGALFDVETAKGDGVTAESRGALAIEIAKVKVVSSDLATDATSRVFEATGSSSTRSSVGLDLYWRNARTHSLHDPVDYKKLEVGANFLTGVLQPLSLYT